MKTLDGGRIGIASQALGIAQGAMDETVKYVKERKQFSKSLGQFQNTQFQLADLQTKVEAARFVNKTSCLQKTRKCLIPQMQLWRNYSRQKRPWK